MVCIYDGILCNHYIILKEFIITWKCLLLSKKEQKQNCLVELHQYENAQNKD